MNDSTDQSSSNMPEWALELLRCPNTHEELHFAAPELIESLKARQAAGELATVQGATCDEEFDAGLVNESETFIHLVRNGIPTLIPGEAIALTSS